MPFSTFFKNFKNFCAGGRGEEESKTKRTSFDLISIVNGGEKYLFDFSRNMRMQRF